MGAKRTALEMTDERFRIDENRDVLRYVTEVNSSAHTDVGTRLLELGKSLPGAQAYSPSFASCMYVVLHTDASRIFALAFGQRGLALRLAPGEVDAAVADGGTRAPEIGAGWVSFPAWGETPSGRAEEVLRTWGARALRHEAGRCEKPGADEDAGLLIAPPGVEPGLS